MKGGGENREGEERRRKGGKKKRKGKEEGRGGRQEESRGKKERGRRNAMRDGGGWKSGKERVFYRRALPPLPAWHL